MNLKEAIEFLEKVKNQKVKDIRKYDFAVKDIDYPDDEETFFTEKELIKWAEELKQEEDENE